MSSSIFSGSPAQWFTGVPIDLGCDKHGNRIIFWSKGDGRCRYCRGETPYETWQRHLIRVSFRARDGRLVIRLSCPERADSLQEPPPQIWRTSLN
jgi:hypothetical protein